MSEIFITVIVMSAVVTLSGVLAHPKSRGNMQRFALGIILLAALSTPILNFTADIPQLGADFGTVSPETQGSEYSDYMEAALREGIIGGICREFSIAEENITLVSEGFNLEELYFEFCKITLSGRGALLDYHAVESFVLSAGAKKCEVNISL